MPTYDGTYKLAVEDGRVLIRDVEGGSQTTHVPLEIYSNYAAQGTLTDSRQLRLRTQPYLESNAANAYVTDMGIESGQTDNYFFITAPQKTANVGDRSTFVISKTSNVGIGTTDPTKPLHVVGDSWVTGTLTASNIVGASPVTISSNLVMASGFTLTAGAIEPPAGSETTLKGGTTASIANSNTFPNFIFSRSSNVAANHVGGAHGAGRHALFPDDTGKVWAVGENTNGALGLGDQTNRNVYTLVSALDGVANIVASSTSGYNSDVNNEETYLLDTTGNVWTCGENSVGQIGQNDTKDRHIPTLVTTNIYSGVSITEISPGTNGGLLLDSTGQIWGTGNNGNYRFGNLSGVTGSITTFTPSMPVGTHVFTSIDSGWNYSLALDNNGRIWSTGSNSFGKTGQGTAANDTAGWTQVDNTDGINDVIITQICNGDSHSFALDSTGNVWATGYNGHGQLGLGDVLDKSYFIKVTSNVNVDQGVTIKKIAAAAAHSYALDTNGRLWGAGRSTYGENGNPPYLDAVSTFVRADAGPIANKSITDFALTQFGSVIARTSDNEYYVTGRGGSSSLGTGDTQDRFTYTKLLDFNANPPPDYGYTRSLLLENTETGKGPSIELKNKNAVSSRIQMEDGASGKLNIGFVDASYDPKLSGGDGAELYPFQERAQSNTMTRGVTINQAGGTMVAGGSTSNVGVITRIMATTSNVSSPAYKDFGAGYAYNIAPVILSNGDVYVVGENGYGQLGLGNTTDQTTWQKISDGKKIVAGCAGTNVTFLISEGGGLWATGRNTWGELGDGTTTDRSTFVVSNTGLPVGTKVVKIVNGDDSTLLLTSDGKVWGTGWNNNGELGIGSTSGTSGTWTQATNNISSLTIVDISIATLAAVVDSNGDVYTCGANGSGQTGHGDTNSYTSFTKVTTTLDTPFITHVSVGASHILALDSDGNVYTCGINTYGQLGLGDTSNRTTFVQVTLSKTIVAVSGGRHHSLILDSEGNVWGTGENLSGELGLGDTTQRTSFTLSKDIAGKNAIAIRAGYLNSAVLLSNGDIYVCGFNDVGQLGLGTTLNATIFTRLNPLLDILPSAFKYTPTLTLENPNPDHGATIEFKNPNNRAFINLDDKTSNLRLGFVNNEDNAGQFKGIQIAADGSLGGGSPLRINSNVGIGTTSPGATLHIVNTEEITLTTEVLRLQRGDENAADLQTNTGGTIGMYIRDSNVGGGEVARISWGHDGDDSSPEGKGRLGFWTSDTGGAEGVPVERMTIRASGRVGIGTTSPSMPLHVYGVVSNQIAYFQANQNPAYIRIIGTSSQCLIGADGSGFTTAETSSIAMFNSSTGNINFYTNGAKRAYLNAAGKFLAQSFGIESDRRLKDNITDIDDENSLEIIRKLKPKTFVMKELKDVKRWGFIANEVEEIVPEAIESNDISDQYIKKSYDATWLPDGTVSALITDEVFEVGDCLKLTPDLNGLKICSVHVKSVSENVYTFEDAGCMVADDMDIKDLADDTQIHIRSKQIHNVKTLNREFIDPVMVSAMQQMLRKIESLEARLVTLENNSA